MRNRLTLNSAHPPEQATNRQEFNPQASGQRQLRELQTTFLTDMLDRTVTVYLVSGIKLSGTLEQHDQFTLLLQGADGIDSLIFKHAISTVTSGASVMTRERRTPFGKRPEWTV